MSHRLFVSLAYSIDADFGTYLKPLEFARGSKIMFVYTVSNIEKSQFNGRLKEIGIRFASGPRASNNPNIEISNLNVDESRQIYNFEFEMSYQGIAWLYCKIEANDKQKIGYYQSKGSQNLGSDEWIFPVEVVNREQIIILKLLEDIKNKLK